MHAATRTPFPALLALALCALLLAACGNSGGSTTGTSTKTVTVDRTTSSKATTTASTPSTATAATTATATTATATTATGADGLPVDAAPTTPVNERLASDTRAQLLVAAQHRLAAHPDPAITGPATALYPGGTYLARLGDYEYANASVDAASEVDVHAKFWRPASGGTWRAYDVTAAGDAGPTCQQPRALIALWYHGDLGNTCTSDVARVVTIGGGAYCIVDGTGAAASIECGQLPQGLDSHDTTHEQRLDAQGRTSSTVGAHFAEGAGSQVFGAEYAPYGIRVHPAHGGTSFTCLSTPARLQCTGPGGGVITVDEPAA